MNDLRKAAEMALEALMQRGEHHPKVYQAAEALRQALDDKPPVKTYCGGKPNYCALEETHEVDETSKGKHEPFIYLRADTEQPFGGYEHCGQHDAGAFPVYTAPPKREWVGLTDEERENWKALGLVGVEIVAAHLKEKNVPQP